jgi:transposase
MRGKGMRGENFQAFLHLIHQHYRCPVYLILDRAGLHIATKSIQLARRLHIELIWLPKQCPELNVVDQLFKSLKADVSANYQYNTIEQHARAAEKYLRSLTNKQALIKAGVKSQNFWLRNKV